MSAAWVVLYGTDSEGGWVVGLTETAELGMSLAEANLPQHVPKPLEWRESKPAAEWFARVGSTVDYIEVTRWEVSA